MKKISILVAESSIIQSIADPQFLFTELNKHLISLDKHPQFKVELVGAKRNIRVQDGKYSIHTDKLLTEVSKTDLVIIPSLYGDLSSALKKNRILIPWIQNQYKKGAEVASLCVGAFLLASTGLLHGKKCSTHWNKQNQLRSQFPDVEVVDCGVITEENRIYSSGGGNTYWNLLLHLVEKYTDRQTAILAAKYFVIDIDRISQSAYALFQGQKEHTDPPVREIQDYIEKNVDKKVSVQELANRVSIGRRSFERRFKQATKNTVQEYIHRVKIEAAKRNFENSQKNINEVMLGIGYTDAKAFRLTFKKVTGLSPAEYRTKYNKMAI